MIHSVRVRLWIVRYMDELMSAGSLSAGDRKWLMAVVIIIKVN